MKAYRIQRPNGKGPYRNTLDGTFRDMMCLRHSWDEVNSHPAPQHEGREPRSCEYSCFASLAQLRRWFTKEELQHLRKLGYKVYVVDGEVPWKSKTQALIRTGYKVVKELGLCDIYK